jgi:hypothetical protein
MVVTDPIVARLPPVRTVMDSLEQNGIAYALYDRVRVEPSDESFLDAIAFGRERPFDAFVAVGGGSTIDTAKAVNLYTTYPPADFLDYVNPPIGKGLPVPGPLKTLMAIPTTAGTGSETPAEADARLSRSGEHADDAAGGRGVDRPRHPQPRDRIAHGDPVHGAPAAGASGAAAGVSRLESDQRRLVDGGAADGREVSRPRGRRSVRR